MKKTSESIVSLRGSIRALQEREGQIKNNRDLSDEGRRKALVAWGNERANSEAQAEKSLKFDTDLLRGEYEVWDRKRAKAQNEAGAAWDYSRLAYEGEAVRARVRMVSENSPGEDLGAIKALIGQAAGSGDQHRARAWLEIGAAALLDRFGNSDDLELKMAVNSSIRESIKQLDVILTTPELTDVEAEHDELTGWAVELKQVVEETGAFFYPTNQGPLSTPDPFNRLLEGVTIHKDKIPGGAWTGWKLRLEISDKPLPEGEIVTDKQRRESLGLS